MSLDRCRLVELPKIVDARGNLKLERGSAA
jgi:hypothetical protein